MKITIDIDCTPDEARQFIGLPDLKPLQTNVMARVEAQMVDALDRFSADSVLRSWLSLMPPGSGDMRTMFEQFMKGSAGTKS